MAKINKQGKIKKLKAKKEGVRKPKTKPSIEIIRGPKFCPICKSINITTYAGFVSASYRCKNCGYVGNFFLEEFKKIRNF